MWCSLASSRITDMDLAIVRPPRARDTRDLDVRGVVCSASPALAPFPDFAFAARFFAGVSRRGG